MSAIPFHPLADLFPLLEGDDFAALVADVRAHGLRQYIVLCNGAILDGRNRYRACLEAGIEPHFEVFNGADPLAFVLSMNLQRRHLSESQRAMVHARIATLPKGSNQHTAIAVPTQEQAASLLNISVDSGQRARKVLEHGIPELTEKVDRGDISVSAASEVARLDESEQREIVARGEKEILAAAREIRARKWDAHKSAAIARTHNIEFKAQELGKFAAILADPPWRLENPSIGTPDRRVENHYPTMSLDEICALPVADIAHDDAILFLWATAPKLAECMQVIKAWGFVYRTGIVWIKDKIGMGYYVRNRHEHLLICKRGELPMHPPESARCASAVEAPRLEHSAKPEIFHEIIDAMYPGMPKIELFARKPRDGWSTWGNELGEAVE